MTISAKDWAMYVARLSRLGKTAESMMKEYIAEHGSEDIKDITEFAFGLVTKYGEGAASLACEMYEALAKAQGAKVPAASPAYTARFWETKVAMKGTTDAEKPAAVSRLVKRAGADTTMQNAIRDSAQFAWIPSGDSCPFCIALASRGWQYASKKSLKNGHAEHIHANCDCQYAIRFDKTSTVQGYDPEKYRDMYYSAEGSTPQEKINSMRREMAAEKKKFNPLPQDRVVPFLRKEAKAWINLLNDEEEKYIRKYTYNAGDNPPERLFERINAMLRGDKPRDPTLEKIADTISGAIRKYNLKHDVIAFRGVDVDPTIGMNVGDVFMGEQFFSSSVIESKSFGKLFKIVFHVPKGASAAYIEDLSEFPEQRELLLDKGGFYKILSRRGNEIELEVL